MLTKHASNTVCELNYSHIEEAIILVSPLASQQVQPHLLDTASIQKVVAQHEANKMPLVSTVNVFRPTISSVGISLKLSIKKNSYSRP